MKVLAPLLGSVVVKFGRELVSFNMGWRILDFYVYLLDRPIQSTPSLLPPAPDMT
jgi:hypothetical protein